jgi:hypothetical protein
MKKLTFLVVLCLLSIDVYAMSGVTKGGHAVCFSKEWLEDMVSFVAAKDRASFESHIDSKKCFIVNEGLRVTVTESPGMFGRTTGFVYKGVKLWTVRHALDYGK